MTRSILFICTANICRSPMAEGLLKMLVSDEPDAWRIESAGVWAHPDQPAALYTRYVLQDRGILLPDFHSRPVNRVLLGEFNLILTMERNHKEALRAAFPEFGYKIRTLREMVGKSGDIVDPIGGPIEAYEDTAREIHYILTESYDDLRRLAANAPEPDFTADSAAEEG